jgi:hypothetical protein
MHYAYELCRFSIVPFLDSLRVAVRVCYLCQDARSVRNFGSITLMFSIALFSGVQLKSSGVML